MMEFFKFMDANCPMDVTSDYAKNLSPDTSVLLRPWMCPWSVDSGNSGWVEAETQRNLTLLVFTQSFQTNSDISGVHKPVVTTRNPLLFQCPFDSRPKDWVISKGLLAAHELMFVKGWRRCCSMLIAVHIIKVLNLLDEIKSVAPDLISSIATIHARVGKYATDADCIDANRDISLASAATRSKPNAFNHLHQIERKVKLGVKREMCIEQLQTPKVAQFVFGIGKTEAEALVNIAANMDSASVDILRNGATRFGMAKGPISHAGLACSAMCLGQGPTTSLQQWDVLMKSDQPTLALICTRINGDFERMPAGRLRKSAGPEEVRQLQLVCRAFELCKADLIASVGQEVWDAHEALLRKKFLSKNMDTELEKMLEGWPIVDNKPHVDIEAVAEFGQILSQQVRDVEMQASSKANELKLKMETATHEQMVHALGNDENKLCVYFVNLAKAKHAWGI